MIIILLLLLFTLFMWYGGLIQDTKPSNYPETQELIEDYKKYVGRNAKVNGEVVHKNHTKTGHDDDTKILKIKDMEKDVSIGDRLSVYGTVRNHRNVKEVNTIVVPYIYYIYMYAVYLIGVSWISIRTSTYWRWNRKRSCFEQRDKTIYLKQLFIGSEDDG